MSASPPTPPFAYPPSPASAFDFATSSRVVFGPGARTGAGSLIASLGRHPMVVVGKDVRRSDWLLKVVQGHTKDSVVVSVAGEPTVTEVSGMAAAFRQSGCDSVIACGGGSVLDAGKAISALAANPGDPLEFLEVIGRGNPLANAPFPSMAIPTTAGTGAEVTRNAVLASEQDRVKVSLRHSGMIPRIALVDPELCAGLSRWMTASTGMDALTQLIEAFVSCRANPMTDALCREGIRRAAIFLPRAVDDGGDMAARAQMSLASLWSGMALANAGLGAVHGFAGPIGGMFGTPHGNVCAALLAPVMEVNWRTLAMRTPDSPSAARFDELGQLLTASPAARAADAIGFLRDLTSGLSVPDLADLGIPATASAEIVDKASKASSMKGNPVALGRDELFEILERAGLRARELSSHTNERTMLTGTTGIPRP